MEKTKKINLCITNPGGIVVEEDNIEIPDGGSLIVQFTDNRTFENAIRAGAITEMIEDFKKDPAVLVLPPFISLKVLKRG